MSPAPPPLSRRSARAILLDRIGRVLLIRFDVIRDGAPFVFWATPGGTVEAGETDLEAAIREIGEELAVDVELAGPVHVEVDRFMHNGSLVENTDVFFVGHLEQEMPRIHAATEDERTAMQAIRWWSIDEVDRTTETIFPRTLGALARRIG